MRRHRSFWISLGLAAALLSAGACDGVDPNLPAPGIGPGGNWEFVAPEIDGSDGEGPDLAVIVCSKLSACGVLDAEELAECQSMMGREIPFIIDTAAFASCLADISCQELTDESIGNLLLGCIDLDMQSMSCIGNSLHYCNSAGSCKTTPCSEICSFIGESGSRCVSLGPFGLCECMWSDELSPD